MSIRRGRVDVTTIGRALAAYKTGAEIYSNVREWRRQRVSEFTLTMSEQDRLYIDVQTWLLSLPAAGEAYSWAARSSYGRTIAYTYDGGRDYQVTSGTTRIGFRIKSGNGDDNEAKDSDSLASYLAKHLVMTVRTAADLDHLKRQIERIASEKTASERPPSICIYSKWGWDRSEAPLRSLSSVVLAEDLKEQVSADIGRFLASESDYVERGLPWHRGILLHGPPGTGKTSLVKGLAREHGLDIYFLSLSDMKSDGDLIDRFHEVRPKSIVLLEDVDSASAATARESDAPGVTTSGLLNALDGMFTPHGMIAVLTTNHVERLDPAIIRPGRVDLRIYLDYCTSDQVGALFASFYGRAPRVPFAVPKRVRLSSAAVTESFKANLYDAGAAEHALRAHIADLTREAIAEGAS